MKDKTHRRGLGIESFINRNFTNLKFEAAEFGGGTFKAKDESKPNQDSTSKVSDVAPLKDASQSNEKK